MPYGYMQIKGKSYKKIVAYRAKFMAEGYAATLRLGFTDYTDIQVVRSGSWWTVCGLHKTTVKEDSYGNATDSMPLWLNSVY